MIVIQFLLLLAAALSLLSCAKKEAEPAQAAQRATVTLRDGTQVTGAVLDESPTEIRITGDDKITRIVPRPNVARIEYPAPPQPPQPPQAGAPQEADPDPVHDRHEHPGENVVTTRTHEVSAGAAISVRNEETIDSGRAVEGQTFAAEVAREVRDADGAVVIPRGANAQIIIRSASKGGHFRGAPDLVLDLKSVSIDGRQYQLATTDIREVGKQGVGANKRTAEYTGGGAAIGALIGALAGHGKGAAIGAGAGAGAGALTQIVTRGSIRVPAETVLTFRLERPLRVVAAQ